MGIEGCITYSNWSTKVLPVGLPTFKSDDRDNYENCFATFSKSEVMTVDGTDNLCLNFATRCLLYRRAANSCGIRFTMLILVHLRGCLCSQITPYLHIQSNVNESVANVAFVAVNNNSKWLENYGVHSVCPSFALCGFLFEKFVRYLNRLEMFAHFEKSVYWFSKCREKSRRIIFPLIHYSPHQCFYSFHKLMMKRWMFLQSVK